MLWPSLSGAPAHLRAATLRMPWAVLARARQPLVASVERCTVRHRSGGLYRKRAAKMQEERQERQIDRQVAAVKDMLKTVQFTHAFKKIAVKDRFMKHEARMAARAIITNPIALDRAYRLFTRADGELNDPRLVAEVFELLKLYRPPKYEELDVDLSQPHQWFPIARTMHRTLHLHIGPTNSGKTHSALEALSAAESGWYAGPLRLLAWEVHDRLNKNKHNHERGPVACNLLTGQEIETHPDARHTSSTVEMVDVFSAVEVGVVDEIQMIGDGQRGWAWTRAVLGLPARELHMCGDPSATEIIQRMCELTGDTLHVHEYNRLSPLIPISKPLRDLSALKQGDCVVAFSKKELYKLKKRIETITSHKCSLVYGGLPPETRRSQAELFNTGSNSVLVATDAVGMGLNLQIGRVIMSSLAKFDGDAMRSLHPPETKQIVGRAGRYGSQFPEGHAMVMNTEDVASLADHLARPVVPLDRAGLMPPFEIVQAVAHKQPDLSLHDLVARFESVRNQDRSLYFMCSLETVKAIARMLQAVPSDALALHDRWVVCMAPVQIDDRDAMVSLKDYALGYTYERTCRLPRWQAHAVLNATVPATPQELSVLEKTYLLLDLYLWLGNRLGEDVFVDMDEVFELRDQCCDLIDQGLEQLTANEVESDRRTRMQRGRARRPVRADPSRTVDAVTEAGRELESVIVKLERLRLKNQAREQAEQAREARAEDDDIKPASRSFF